MLVDTISLITTRALTGTCQVNYHDYVIKLVCITSSPPSAVN